jgi:hypothetical protein
MYGKPGFDTEFRVWEVSNGIPSSSDHLIIQKYHLFVQLFRSLTYLCSWWSVIKLIPKLDKH